MPSLSRCISRTYFTTYIFHHQNIYLSKFLIKKDGTTVESCAISLTILTLIKLITTCDVTLKNSKPKITEAVRCNLN